MSTKDLIERLSADARPVQRHSLRTIIWPSLSVGTFCALAIMVMSFGLRQDLQNADVITQLMAKAVLGLIAMIAGLAALVPSLRPDMGSVLPKRILGATLLALGAIAVVHLAARCPMCSVLYLSANVARPPCVITLLAIAPFACLAFTVRSEAPTHLNVTGAALGLTSGGIGAVLYAFARNEPSTSLDLAWFSVGIVMTTVLGMIAAPRVLRW